MAEARNDLDAIVAHTFQKYARQAELSEDSDFPRLSGKKRLSQLMKTTAEEVVAKLFLITLTLEIGTGRTHFTEMFDKTTEQLQAAYKAAVEQGRTDCPPLPSIRRLPRPVEVELVIVEHVI